MNAFISSLNTVGQTYHRFRVTKAVEITELQCFLRELVHEPTGARVMHIANDDPENLFCLSFQTLPPNSNGVAHILEHTVLCGSKKFPVKDPFFAMKRRSLNTFMNALTGSDFTCYPAASQVPTDFYNLLEVYLDAVFQPHIKLLSFLQEGHRLEFAQANDPSSPLEFKGIVYNEMKGALSSASARLAEAINAALFPDIVYGYNSGGDPKDIPSLSYEALKEFYYKYYHKSRCLYFFYGNMPLEGHLDFLTTHALHDTQPAPALPPIPLQKRYEKPIYRELTYPIALEEDATDKSMIAFGWLTCHILDHEDLLALNILEIILMNNDASPLKMALLKSGLCKQANSFIDVEINEIPCGVILKGCDADKVDEIDTLLKDSLRVICEKGIALQAIENAIHQLEFYRTEITGEHGPFGLSLFMRSGLLLQHGADPEKALRIHTLFETLRNHVSQNPHYFSDLIKKYFLNNPHHVRIVMRPDKEQGAREVAEEKAHLEKVKQSLSPEQMRALVRQATELVTFQQEQTDAANFDTLPKVALSDIPPQCKQFELKQEQLGKLTVFHHPTFTNEIVYADLVFDLPDFSEDEIPYLRLLTLILTQVSCGSRHYTELLEYIQGHTGGIGAGINFNLQAQDHHQFHPTFHMRGKALHRNASKFFPLLSEIINSSHLDDLGRIKEIVVKHFSAMESRLSQSALRYAVNLSASGLSTASKLAEDLYGLTYYWKVREIVRNFDQEGPLLLTKLKKIQAKLSHLDNPHLVISCSQAMYDEYKAHQFFGLQDIETRPYPGWIGNYPLKKIASQGRVIASPVAFISKVFSALPYAHPDAPALSLAAFLFDNLTLHTRIREQGGAYGSGAISNPMSGNFYFYSYRDPNVVSTLRAFEEAVERLISEEFDEADLEETKFEMMQTLDNPISPGNQAELAYSWLRAGRTVELRQRFRDKILSLTREEVIQAVKKHLIPTLHKGATVVFASQELLDKANLELVADSQEPLLIKGI